MQMSNRASRVVMALLLVGAGIACAPGGEEAATPGEAPARGEGTAPAGASEPAHVTELAGTFDTVFTLAQEILERIEAEDLDGLVRLRVSEAEFYWLVWPELPSSQPERNLTWDYVWRDLNQKSLNSARRVIDRHGGRSYQLMRVEFADETTDYASYRVHRDARVVVQDAAGEILTLDLFGSVIERNGRFKAFSLVTD